MGTSNPIGQGGEARGRHKEGNQGTSDRPTQEPGEEESASWPFLGLLPLLGAADGHKRQMRHGGQVQEATEEESEDSGPVGR